MLTEIISITVYFCGWMPRGFGKTPFGWFYGWTIISLACIYVLIKFGVKKLVSVRWTKQTH